MSQDVWTYNSRSSTRDVREAGNTVIANTAAGALMSLVGAEVVGAEVVGAEVVGAEVVGAEVVGAEVSGTISTAWMV